MTGILVSARWEINGFGVVEGHAGRVGRSGGLGRMSAL
jgi:hypothetical protein